jgi:hypothetical protein
MQTQTVLDSRTKFPTLAQIKEIGEYFKLKEAQHTPSPTHHVQFPNQHSRL